MAKLTRKTQKIFAGAVSPTGVVSVFGSLAAGAPAFSSDPDVIQSLPAYGFGWNSALINAPGGLSSPALEDDNSIKYLLSRQVAYLMQAGVAEWDPATVYFIGSWVNIAGFCFISKTDNNLANNPLTDSNNWKTLASTLSNLGASSCKAWVNFNGFSGGIYSQFNVGSVFRTAVGCYQLNFTAPMSDANYAFSGSCGVTGGGTYTGGDDNYVTGGAPGKAQIKTPSALTVFCYDRGNTNTEDSSSISVIVFGN